MYKHYATACVLLLVSSNLNSMDVTTIDGDSGSASGPTVTITGGGSSGSGIQFTGDDSSTITASISFLNLPLTDTSGNGVIYLDGTPNPYLHAAGGVSNVFLGSSSGSLSTTGTANTAVGIGTLNSITDFGGNTAIGADALNALTGGYNNTALGLGTLDSLDSGFCNVAVGYNAGNALGSNESYNIYLGYQQSGVANESNTMRLGSPNYIETTYIAGVTGSFSNGSTVLCDDNGVFGTVSSSLRYKYDVVPMPNKHHEFMRLKPVNFKYKKDPKAEVRYGLIAEDVAEVFPDLAIVNDKGEVESIKYHELTSVLIAEIQELYKRIADLEKKLNNN